MKYAYSYSRLYQYLNCKKAFYYAVIKKEKSLQNMAMMVGSYTHNLISKYIMHLKKSKLKSDYAFLDNSVENYLGDLPKENYDDLSEIMSRFKESFTLPDFDMFLYSEKDYAFSDVWSQMNWFDKSVFFRAKIDLIWGNKNILFIEDYKTNRYLQPQSEVEGSLQLLLYAMTASKVFDIEKFEKIIVRMNFVRYSTVYNFEITVDQIKETESRLIKYVNKIETTKEFKAQICGYCSMCSFRHLCSLYRTHLKNFDVDTENPVLLAQKLFIAKQFCKDVTGLLKDIVEQSGPIKIGNQVLDFHSKNKDNFDTIQIVNKLIENGINKTDVLDKLTINKTSIKSLTKGKELKGLRDEVLGMAIVKAGTEFGFKEIEIE